MATVASNGIEIEVETLGDPADPTLLMIMGLGAQLVAWDDEFVGAFVDRGFHVVRFDNRDVGLSTKTQLDPGFDVGTAMMAAVTGEGAAAPYLLSDMAADAVGVLDALAIDAAHVVGVSMGGMITQQVAIDHPARVLSMTSIMSTTGDLDVGMPRAEIAGTLLTPPPADRDGAIAHSVEVSRTIGSPDHLDDDRARQRATRAYDRCFYPLGVGVQLTAIVASGSRSERLRALDVPALVIHGTADPLVDVSGGRRTAEVIPGARLIELEGMGHDMPTYFWTPIIEGVTSLAAGAAAAA